MAALVTAAVAAGGAQAQQQQNATVADLTTSIPVVAANATTTGVSGASSLSPSCADVWSLSPVPVRWSGIVH